LLGWFVVLVAGTAVGAGLARYWMRRLIIGASRHVEFEFRNDFFAHLLRLSPSFYDRHRTGDLMSRSTTDMDAIRTVIGPCIMYIANTMVLAPLTVVKMMQISPALTAICWLPLLLLIPLVFYFKQRINLRYKRVQELMSDLSTDVQETLGGIRVIKTYAREDRRAGTFDAISGQYVEANMHLARLQSVLMPLLEVVIGLSLLALIAAGSVMIIRQNAPGAVVAGAGLTLGDLMTFFLLLNHNIWPIAAFGWVLAQIERGSASMARVEEIYRQQPEIVEPAAPASGGNGDGRRAVQGAIELRDLTFAHPGAAQPSLRDLSLTIPAGMTLGVTGPVGCGKSTLAALVARRYNPPRGTVFIDGGDILDWPVEDLRRCIGIVDQEPFLFSDSIAANVGFGVVGASESTNAEALEQRVLAAAFTAQLSGDVESFPHAYQTILGERGINLSGGQRQRTALARALARDPALLILDDALAAVDTHTEEAILGGLRKLLGSRTTILISHRISTMSLADRIAYLEDGRLVEEGTHEELLALKGHYWQLAERQKLAEEIEKTA
jgi:ATP-binding cassette subfamily B protein